MKDREGLVNEINFFSNKNRAFKVKNQKSNILEEPGRNSGS